MGCEVFFFGCFDVMRVLFVVLKEVLRNVSVAKLAVSQTAKHKRRADVQSVWPCWSLQPPLPLILRGNALAGTVCFPCVCGFNCRFAYISDPHLLISFLAPGASKW